MTDTRKAVEVRIRELYEEHSKITADIVINDAKNPESPLHGEFEWDVNKAAMEEWRDTARRLIRSVTIVVHTETKSFTAQGYQPPEFVRDPSNTTRDQGYVRVHDIRSDKERSRSALMYEIDRINGSLARARSICTELNLESEFTIVDNAIKTFRKKVAVVA